MCLYLHICFAPSFASQSFQICLAHTQTYIHTRASSLTPHLNSPAAPVSEHSPITHPSFQLQQTRNTPEACHQQSCGCSGCVQKAHLRSHQGADAVRCRYIIDEEDSACGLTSQEYVRYSLGQLLCDRGAGPHGVALPWTLLGRFHARYAGESGSAQSCREWCVEGCTQECFLIFHDATRAFGGYRTHLMRHTTREGIVRTNTHRLHIPVRVWRSLCLLLTDAPSLQHLPRRRSRSAWLPNGL